MNIELLKTFVAVKRYSNITQAAQFLGLTQPAISKRIATLEQQLNCQLFYRIGSGLVPTQAGKILSPASDDILNLIDNTIADIRSLGDTLSGNLEIACSHHIGLYQLPKVLAQFKKALPAVKLHFHFTESEDAYLQAYNGVVDLALLTLPEKSDGQVIQQLLWTDEMEIMIAASHPLIQSNQQNNSQALLEVPAIFTDDTDFTRLRLEQKFSNYKLNKSNDFGANNLELIRMLIEAEQGWGVLPTSMRNNKLKSIQLKKMNFSRPLGYAYHKQRHPNKAAVEFINIVRN